jgi:hypothetical protein
MNHISRSNGAVSPRCDITGGERMKDELTGFEALMIILVTMLVTAFVCTTAFVPKLRELSAADQKIAAVRSVAQYNQDYKDYEWKTIVDIVDGAKIP